ncbi:radial spoke head 10 homolog B, partial [Stegastes partitus]|uniref:Radial spoke head 10 homolog B n=1 Tax=Stegastes partitus TaxID=144197 RepID=A0A9Y4NMM6_9TELE
GEFVCNKPMGRGVYTWPDGNSYEGEVYSGIRHGSGTYKCTKNYLSYKGQWYQGERHGKGTVYYNEDKTSWYKGEWMKNNREGWGVRCYPSGNIYSGEWKNNMRHGEGTMKWLKQGQEYVGTWQDGVQHGRGTHVWILRRVDGSQYFQSNHYKGDFVQGQRHGQGTFHYASGAVYEGEWRNNKKHGQGKFTFTDGRVFEGEFVDDQMMTPSLRAPTPLGAFPLSDSDSVLGPDMALNIECLLEKVPERKRDTERKQVEFVVLRQDIQLRSIYSFYSRLGCVCSPDNTFLLSRLQLWRLLKDCNIHHHGITLTQIDHVIRDDASSAEIHSPFTPILLWKLLRCLVITAYHIYNKDMMSQKNLLASCLSKMMTDDILPNAKNVKGFLFRQPDLAVVAMKYVKRCWEVYQAYCRVSTASKDDLTMTCRHLLWMFKDLQLLDHKLTTVKLMDIITAESCDPSNRSSCLDLQITFLEFFEVLLGCAEVKCQQTSEVLEEGRRPLSGCDSEARRDVPEGEASEEMMQTINSPSLSSEDFTAQDVESGDIKTNINETPSSAEHREERSEGNDVQTSVMETKDHKVELRTQAVHQFFNHIFFPAFDHHQLVTRNTEEKLRQDALRHNTLA